ncbi:MAG: glycosyltransferase family 4 protein [bacterium]
MKVLLVNKFNFLRGGSDKYFLDLASLLSANGIEIAKFCMHHPNNLPDKYNKYWLDHINFGKFEWKSAWKYLARMFYSREAKDKFEKMIQDFQPDIIHLNNIYHQISPSILDVAKKHNLPVIMHLHDYKLVCGNYKMFNNGQICEKCKGGKHFKCTTTTCFKKSFFKSFLVMIEMYLHHKVLKIYEKNVDMYIAPSEFMRKKMIDWGVPAEKINTLHHFIDLKEFNPEYELGDYLLYFGRLSEEKGIDYLLEAIKMSPDAKLKIVGAGPMSGFVKKRIEELKISQRVELIGPKYNEELKNILCKSYAVIVPSRWYEVFGLVSMEAGGLGKAVLGADIGGIPEVIKDKQTGILFNPFLKEDLAMKISWAIDHPSEISAMGRAGRQFVAQEFDPGKHFNGLMSLYKKVSIL